MRVIYLLTIYRHCDSFLTNLALDLINFDSTILEVDEYVVFASDYPNLLSLFQEKATFL